MRLTALLYCLLFLCLSACQPNAHTGEEINERETLRQYFPERGDLSDTLHFSIQNERELADSPALDSLLEQALPDTVFEKVLFGVEETGKHEPAYRFALDERHEACVLHTTEHWYFQTSLLIFDKETGHFTDMEVLAQFYGGDGGQIAVESWYWPGELYRKEAFHSIRFNPDINDVEENTGEVSALLSWQGGAFQATTPRDSLALSTRFPMTWEW